MTPAINNLDLRWPQKYFGLFDSDPSDPSRYNERLNRRRAKVGLPPSSAAKLTNQIKKALERERGR